MHYQINFIIPLFKTFILKSYLKPYFALKKLYRIKLYNIAYKF